MTEDDEPHGFIECDGDLMGFWLPEGVDPDVLRLNWIPA
jgi:hypothetical protein